MIAGLPTPTGQFVVANLRRPFSAGYDDSTGLYSRPTATPSGVVGLVLMIESVVVPGSYAVDVNLSSHAVVASQGDDRDDVAAALAAAIGGGPEPVGATARPGGQVVITADDKTVPFTAIVTAGDVVMLGELEEITVSKQPDLSARDRDMLPEGHRESEAVKFYTDASVRGVDELTGNQPDVLEFQDDLGRVAEFQVVQARQYEMGQLDHTKAIAVRLTRGTAGS